MLNVVKLNQLSEINSSHRNKMVEGKKGVIMLENL